MAAPAAALTEDQAAVYDRQLRVWGVEVQNRLTNAKVLIVGGNGLAAEVAKNITLAGVGNITILDATPCSSAPPGNFLIPADASPVTSVAEASAKTLQAMNPLIKVTASSSASAGAQEVEAHDLVVACGLSLSAAEALDDQCVTLGKKIFLADVHGPSSYVFANLGAHTYTQKDKPGEKTLKYCSFGKLIRHPLKQTKPRTHPLFSVLQACHTFECQHGGAPARADDAAALQALHAKMMADAGLTCLPLHAELAEGWALDAGEELAPICAVVGGVVANNVIRAVSHVNEPLYNLFLYGVHDGMGLVETLLGEDAS